MLERTFNPNEAYFTAPFYSGAFALSTVTSTGEGAVDVALPLEALRGHGHLDQAALVVAGEHGARHRFIGGPGSVTVVGVVVRGTVARMSASRASSAARAFALSDSPPSASD
jgi:hypothetical protein